MLRRNPCACHAKSTLNPLWTSKSGPRPWCFNDFDFWIVLARRRGANFADVNFQKCSDHASSLRFWLPNRCRAQAKEAPGPSVFNDSDFQIALAGCKFWQVQLPKVLPRPHVWTILTSKSLSRAGVVQILPRLQQPILRTRPFLGVDFPRQRSHKTMEKHNISRTSYPPNPHVSHLCCITSARSHLLVDIFSNNSQYSRKLDS